jgi:hypothetical protein
VTLFKSTFIMHQLRTEQQLPTNYLTLTYLGFDLGTFGFQIGNATTT